jgi:nucleoid-associated protein YgaU
VKKSPEIRGHAVPNYGLQNAYKLNTVIAMNKGVFKMTADAKVGLLLGLFFIVIIAFLVNGLPNFIQEENTSPPNAAIVTSARQDMVLGDNVPEVVHRLYPPRVESRQTVPPPQETIVLGASPEQTSEIEIPEIITQHQTSAVVVNTPSTVIQQPVAAPELKTHVVKQGESLPVIAKLYYGSEEGNRRIVIQKLYEANSRVLKSPDQVRVGDKLLIPTLDAMLNPSTGIVKTPNPSESLLEKFSGMFKKVDEKESASVSEYMVQEGDSLWSIAQRTLGDGNRYKEIVKLNKDAIKNASDIAVGTRLKIPAQ